MLGFHNLGPGAVGCCWRFENHNPSALSVSQELPWSPSSTPSHDPSALSVSGRLRSHDLSCLSMLGGLPGCSEVTIYRACRCLEASQGATRPSEPPSTDLIVAGLVLALQRSLDHSNVWKAPFLTRRVRFARRILYLSRFALSWDDLAAGLI